MRETKKEHWIINDRTFRSPFLIIRKIEFLWHSIYLLSQRKISSNRSKFAQLRKPFNQNQFILIFGLWIKNNKCNTIIHLRCMSNRNYSSFLIFSFSQYLLNHAIFDLSIWVFFQSISSTTISWKAFSSVVLNFFLRICWSIWLPDFLVLRTPELDHLTFLILFSFLLRTPEWKHSSLEFLFSFFLLHKLE